MEENKQVSTPTEAELERERALADTDHPIHHERVTKAILRDTPPASCTTMSFKSHGPPASSCF